MKKLLSVLFISSVVFFSCTKQDPIEVSCNCGGLGISVDTSLVGYWDGDDISLFIGTDLSGNFYTNSYEVGGSYSCDGSSYLSFTDNTDSYEIWTGSYAILGDQMTLNIVDGTNIGFYTLTKH